jgi:hypothetical protein
MLEIGSVIVTVKTSRRGSNASYRIRLCIRRKHAGQIARRFPVLGARGTYSAIYPAGFRGARALDAVAFEERAPLGWRLAHGQKLDQVLAKNKHGLLISDRRQAALGPSPDGPLCDPTCARHFVYRVAAMDIDTMP